MRVRDVGDSAGYVTRRGLRGPKGVGKMVGKAMMLGEMGWPPSTHIGANKIAPFGFVARLENNLHVGYMYENCAHAFFS